MKAVTAITLNDILDWIAEAGSICSGILVEYRELRDGEANAYRLRNLLHDRDRFLQSRAN
ncbi:MULTISPECIES: hypothetical protein [unclassified Rhizobium]|jgi:hypothetical protein|uniref:hypothetical protein n=1 Tax=unclassified Rhizobium TaxID=2613769 RepID=UPI000DD9787F|nr:MULTISPECIES: hypothetical protein [unclassified Rhizobium]MBB3446850.1 hypothetical protein [Rhizobium sp. BK379]MBB3565034.1 hypothetical protein [Rhizobium sp. BK512]